MNPDKTESFSWKFVPIEAEGISLGMTEINHHIPIKELNIREQNELSAIKHAGRKAELASSRFLLKNMAISLGFPNDFHIEKDDNGKPYGYFGDTRCPVSISHSQNWIFGGISKSKEIGLDIEPVTRNVNPLLSQRIRHGEESSLVKELVMIRLWTIKESILKLTGTGLRKNMADINVKRTSAIEFCTILNDKKIAIQSFKFEQWWIALSSFE